MVLPDPERSRAVLIGCAEYRNLDDLPAVSNNLAHLESALVDPELWGLPPSHCTTLLDPGSVDAVLEAIHMASAEAADALVVYFAGHGLLDPRTSDLYLALADASPMRLFKAIRYDDLRREVVETARCSAKIVILDCCYSGQAMLGGMAATTDIADQARIEGTYLLTASAETKLALAPVGEPYTAFTGEILRVFRDGIANGADLLEVETLYWHVRSELEAKGRPVPQQRIRNDGRSLALVRNRYGRGQRAPKEQEAAAARAHNIARLPPGQVVVELDRLGSAERESIAQAVLTIVSGTRPAEEVVALIERLRLAGHGEDAERVVRLAANRPVAEVVALLRVLFETGASFEADLLLREVAHTPVAHLARVAAALADPAHLDRLIDHAARAQPDVDAAVQIARSLAKLDANPAAERVIARAGRRLTSGENLATLLAAVSAAELAASARQLLTAMATTLTDEEALRAADRLQESGRHDLAAELLTAFAAHGPLDRVTTVVDHLRDMGRPITINRLLEHAAQTRSAPEIAELLRTLGSMAGARRRIGLAASDPAASWATVEGDDAAPTDRTLLQAVAAGLAERYDGEWSTAGSIGVLRALAARSRYREIAVVLYEMTQIDVAAAGAAATALVDAPDVDWRLRLLHPPPDTESQLQAAMARLGWTIGKPWRLAAERWRQGDQADARRDLVEMIKYGGDRISAAAAISLAVLLRDDRGNVAAAVKLLDRAARAHDPSAAIAKLHRAVLYEVAGEPNDALRLYQDARQTADPECAALAALHLGWLLADRGDDDTARVAFREGLTKATGTTSDWLRLALGTVLNRDGEVQAARKHWRAAANSADGLAAGYAYLLLADISTDPEYAEALRDKILDSETYAELWPLLLDKLTSNEPTERIQLMSDWLTWLRYENASSVILYDRRKPSRRLTARYLDGLELEVAAPMHRIGRLRRGDDTPATLDGLGFWGPTEAGTMKWGPRLIQGRDDVENVARISDSALVDVLGAPPYYELSVEWHFDTPMDKLPRPPVPTLVP